MGRKEAPKTTPGFEPPSAANTDIAFKNEIDTAKVNIPDRMNMKNGSGVGIRDFNNDNLENLFWAIWDPVVCN